MDEPVRFELYVGIDIGARSASVSWRRADGEASPAWSVTQDAAGHRQLVEQLSALARPQMTQVVMEATGSYWLALARQLHEHGFGVSIVNPVQPLQFARLRLQRAKSDAIDARLLADFACLMPLPGWTPPPAIQEQLQQRLALRDDLLKIRTEQRNRLHALLQNPRREPTLVQRLQQHLAYLESEIKQLSVEIKALLASEHEWTQAARRLRTIPGIGAITTAWILVATHAFTRCQTPEQAVAFAGLVPHIRQSGTSLHSTRGVGGGGHKALRDSLYMAAASAARFNPVLQPLYQRLLERGKPKKVARCAVARKLLRFAWAVVVKQQDFDPDYRRQPVTA